MKKNTIARLQAFNSEILAQALFDLTTHSAEAKIMVDRLTRTSDEAYKSTKRAISALKRSTKFIDWHEARSFTRKLDSIVEDIAAIDITDEQRFDLICRFFETDEATFNRVDDSSGYIGDVYRVSAQAVFTQCAAQVVKTNQALIAKELEHLLKGNDYGVRDYLLSGVVANLDDATNRALVERFSALSDQVTEAYEANSWLNNILVIASHLKDTRMYELIALEAVAEFDEVPTVTKIEIASNYFNCSEFQQAKKWIDKIDANETFMAAECNRLLVKLHGSLGNNDERDRIARADFNRAPSVQALDTLLKTIGERHREEVVSEQVKKMLAEKQYSDVSASFLLELGRFDSASQYILNNRNTIDGRHYWYLPKFATAFLKAEYPLAAVCIYRALLNSILKRGNTKTYFYGVRYLMKLDQLADTPLPDGMDNHALYKQSLIQSQGKKYSFWNNMMRQGLCEG